MLLKERTRIEGIEQQIISQEGIPTTKHDSFNMIHIIWIILYDQAEFREFQNFHFEPKLSFLTENQENDS